MRNVTSKPVNSQNLFKSNLHGGGYKNCHKYFIGYKNCHKYFIGGGALYYLFAEGEAHIMSIIH